MSKIFNDEFRLEIERFVESKKKLNKDQFDLLNELLAFNLRVKIPLIGIGEPIDKLELTVKLSNILKAGNIYSISDLVQSGKRELFKVKGFTPTLQKEITKVMDTYNLSFAY